MSSYSPLCPILLPIPFRLLSIRNDRRRASLLHDHIIPAVPSIQIPCLGSWTRSFRIRLETSLTLFQASEMSLFCLKQCISSSVEAAVHHYSTSSLHVKTLVLRRLQGWRGFPDSRAWVERFHLPSDPEHELARPADVTHHHDNKVGESLLPYSNWVGMTEKEKEALYHEYEADRKQAHDQVRDWTSTLRFHVPDFESGLHRAWMRRATKTSVDASAGRSAQFESFPT
jgi:hypothetical protein